MPTKRMLIIESEKAFSDQIRAMFAEFDVEISVYEDGKAGQDAVFSDLPDIVLLCVELPKMSGYTICTKLKKDKKTRDIPLIIMSSEATEETFAQHRRLKARAEDYIIKPFSQDEIVAKVNGLAPLDHLESPADEEIISLDGEEVLIDDISGLDDESLNIEGGEDGSTQLMESPLTEGDEDLDNLEDVLDGLEMDDQGSGPQQVDSVTDSRSKAGSASDLEDFDELLKPLEDVEEPQPAEKAAGKKPQAQADSVEEISLDVHAPDEADLEVHLDEDIQVGEPEPPVQEEEEEALEALEPVIEEVAPQPPPPPPPAAPAADTKPPAAAVPDPVLATKLKNAESECSLLREKVSSLEQKLEEAYRDYEKRISEASSGRRDTSREKDLLALRGELNARDRDVLNLKEEITRKDQEILDVREKIGERDEEIGKLQESVARRDREIKEISGRLEEMLRAKNDLQERHESKMAEWEERYTNDTAKLEHDLQVLREESERIREEADGRVAKVQGDLDRLRTNFEDTKQRHNDEVYGLRTRYKNEFDRLEGEKSALKKEISELRDSLAKEKEAHQQTREQAAEVPRLQQDLSDARSTIEERDEEVAQLGDKISRSEDRLVKAYQKIKGDEKIKEKARKALEIALTLLAEQGEEEESSEEDQDSEHTPART